MLPKGRHRLAVTYAMTAAVDSDFNGSGGTESIAGKYSMEINAANLSKVAPAFRQLVGMLNNSASGAGNQLTAGHLDLDAKGYRQQYVVTEQYGLSDRLSVGFQLPIIRAQVNVRKGLSGINNADQLSRQYIPGNAAEPKDALGVVAGATVSQLEAEVTKLGYAPFQSSDKTGLGDVAFGGRYAYHQDEVVVGSFQLGVTAPTGAVPKPTELVAQPFGEGAWDIGAAHLFQWSPVSGLILGNAVHYTYKLANTQLARVPDSPDDLLPGPGSERSVRRKMGDKAWTGFSLGWKLSSEIAIETAYEWYWRMQDRFYELAGRELEAMRSGIHYSETLSFQVTLSSIAMFLKGRFPIPANLLLSFYHPTRGKNSVIVDYATAELALFF